MSSTLDLTSLFTNLVPASTTSTLLDIITGNGTLSTSTQNPILALRQAEQDQTKDIAATAKDPVVQRDITAFTKAVNSATDIKQLLANPDFQKVFLTSNGLASNIGYTALVQKTLMSNPKDDNSLAINNSDSAWQATVKAFDFYDKGLAAVQDPAIISKLTDAYTEVTWRNSLDTATPGLSNALSFRESASTITSVDQILGDSTMRDVVTTALGLPLEIAIQPLEAQETAISSRLDITQFSNPKFVDQFIDRYLLAKADSSSDSSTDSSSLIELAAQSRGLTV